MKFDAKILIYILKRKQIIFFDAFISETNQATQSIQKRNKKTWHLFINTIVFQLLFTITPILTSVSQKYRAEYVVHYRNSALESIIAPNIPPESLASQGETLIESNVLVASALN